MLSHSQIKHIRSLQQGKFRKEHGLFVAEGPKIVGELPGSSIKVEAVYGLEDWVGDNAGRFEYYRIPLTVIKQKDLERISGLKTPNQVLAVCRMPQREVSEIATDKNLIALDGIRDPGNMGTIIRTADWFGIEDIVCSSDCVDSFNPKVVQATMGSIARVRVYYTDLPVYLAGTKEKVYAMVMDGEDIFNTSTGKGIYVIGNESSGIRGDVLKHATRLLSIPSHGHAESLNAAVATGIVMALVNK